MMTKALEEMQRQLRPEGWLAVMAAVLTLTVLAAHLYLLKPSLGRYRELAQSWSPGALDSTVDRAAANTAAIAELEKEVEEQRGRLYGTSSELPFEQMESHIIDRLDRISVRREVQLVSVTPGEVDRVLMFDELPYDVDVTGDYFALFDWMQAVEDELRPMVVKRFEMSPAPRTQGVAMKLRLVSYRPHGGDG